MILRIPTQLGGEVQVGFDFSTTKPHVNFSQADGKVLNRVELVKGTVTTFDCIERFNQISVSLVCEDAEIVGIRVVSMRRGIGQYAILASVGDCYTEVLYDKITPKESKSTWRMRMS